MSEIQSRLLFAGIALAFLIWGALGSIIGPILPDMTKAFTLSSTQAGFVFIPWSTGFSLGALASKKLLDRYKIEKLLALFAAIATLCCIGLFFCSSFAQFLTIFSLLGAAGGATFTIGHTFIGQTFTTRRVTAISALDLLFSLGNVSSPLLLVLLLSLALGWQFPFLIFAVACSICLIIYAIILLLSHNSAQNEVTKSAKSPSQSEEQQSKIVEKLPLLYLIFPAAFLGAVEWGQNIWFVSYSIDSGASETAARVGHSVFLTGMIIVRIIAILMGQLINDARIVRLFFALTLIGNLLIVLTGSYNLHLFGCLISGVGMGAMFPILLARAMEVDPARSASFSVTMILATTIGGQVASLTIGTLADYFGIGQTFLFTTLFCILLIIAFEVFWRRARAAIEN